MAVASGAAGGHRSPVVDGTEGPNPLGAALFLQMAKSYQLLRVSRIVLLVLAYVSGVSNLIFAGLLPLIMGGEPVPLFLDGPAISVRVLGILNLLITAPLLFVIFYVPSGMIHLLLELRDKAGGSSAAS